MQTSNENVHEHHVTLFSNSDTDHFNNTLTGFTNTLTPPLVLKPLGKWRVGMLDVTHSYNLKRGFKKDDDAIKFPQFLAKKEVKFYTVPHFGAMFAKAPFIYTDSYFHQFLNFEKMLNFPDDFGDFKPPEQKKGEVKAEKFLLNLEMDEEDLRKISRSADIEQEDGSSGRSRRSVQIQNANTNTNTEQGAGSSKTTEKIENKKKDKKAEQEDKKKNSVRDENSNQNNDKPTPEEDKEKDSIQATFKVGVPYTGKQVLYVILVAAKKLMDTHKKTVVEFSYKELRAKALINIASNFIDYLQQEARGRKRFRSEDVHGNYMFVYTDIIPSRHVGSQFHPVLSVLPIKEISHEYTAIKNIQYFPVNKEVINDISLRFNDEFGDPLAFEAGTLPTCVTLHFKRDL
jgi:hypothetical protein